MGRLGILLLLSLLAAMPAEANHLIYDSTASILPPNVPSLGYEATSTREFGGMIHLDSAGYSLLNATITMSNWALESTYQPPGTSAGFTVALTLNLYEVGVANTVGNLIATQTVDALIPWRPEADPSCPGGTAWRASNGQCYNGLATNVVFPVQAVLPQDLIFGLVFNTQHHGYQPTGVPGPYNSLNFGLSTAAPSIGSNPLPGTVYWNTTHAPFYADGGAGGVGVFRQDTEWDLYSGAISLEAVPEPATWMLAALSLAALACRRRLIKACTSGPTRESDRRKSIPSPPRPLIRGAWPVRRD
jgi:hypothetical protein